MQFDNRPPINFDHAEKLAVATRDGGAYAGVGYNEYTVYKGKRYHLVHQHSTGCDGQRNISKHLGRWETLQELSDYLHSLEPAQPGTFSLDDLYPWWASELIEKLGIHPEEA